MTGNQTAHTTCARDVATVLQGVRKLMPDMTTGAIILGITTDDRSEAVLWEDLGGRAVIAHTVACVLAMPAIAAVAVVVPVARFAAAAALARDLADARIQVAVSGPRDVRGALAAGLAVLMGMEVIIVLEGGRAQVTAAECVAVLASAIEHGALVSAAIPVRDTLKIVDGAGYVVATPERSSLVSLQSPAAAPEAIWKAIAQLTPAPPESLMEILLASGGLRTIPGATTNVLIDATATLETQRALRASAG